MTPTSSEQAYTPGDPWPLGTSPHPLHLVACCVNRISRFVKTIGEVPLHPRAGATGSLRLHQIHTKDGLAFGIEVITRSGYSMDSTPLCIAPEQVPQLISLLSEAEDIAESGGRRLTQ